MPKSKSTRKPAGTTKPSGAPSSPKSVASPAPKTMKVTAAPAATTAKVTTDAAEVPVLKKKELIERVVLASGLKKKDVKPAIEATLAVLGRALSAGEELNLQPLGKIKVKNRMEKANGTVINCRVRQSNAAADSGPKAAGGTIKLATFGGQSSDAADPLAEPAE